MKLGFICKYPPLTGGVASRTYWLTRALADRGHEIHIITNAGEIETKFRESFNVEDAAILNDRNNLFIHSTSSENIPPIRPSYNPFDIKIATLALKVIEEYKLDILDSWFLIPNSVAGFMVKQLTGIPWVIRHGGSDLGEHLGSPHFDKLLKEILFKADKIVSHSSNKPIFDAIGIPEEKIWFTIYSLVNRKYFNEAVEPEKKIAGEKPVVMVIGKIGRKKGTCDLLKSFIPVKEKADLVFVTGGPGIEEFKETVSNLGLQNCVKLFPPIPPWRVPSCIRAATCLVHVERDFTIPHYPIVPREIIACKKSLLLSEEMFSKYSFLQRDESVLVVNPHNHAEFSAKLKEMIENRALRSTLEENAYNVSKNIEKYPIYIKNVEEFYGNLL